MGEKRGTELSNSLNRFLRDAIVNNLRFLLILISYKNNFGSKYYEYFLSFYGCYFNQKTPILTLKDQERQTQAKTCLNTNIKQVLKHYRMLRIFYFKIFKLINNSSEVILLLLFEIILNNSNKIK